MKIGARTEDAIYDKIDQAAEHDQSLWRGMTYEDGVQAALRWVLEDDAEDPMEP